MHRRDFAGVAQDPGVAARQDAAARAVQEHTALDDGEDARELVADQHHRQTEPIAQRADEQIQLAGAHGIQAGRGFVQEQQRGFERERPGDGGAFAHAPRERRGRQVRAALEPHEPQAGAHDGRDGRGGQIRPRLQGQRHVLADRHRAEQSAGLKHDAVGRATDGESRRAGARDLHAAAPGRIQSGEGAQQGRLATAARPQHGEDLAALDLEGRGFEEHGLIPPQGEVRHGDERRAHRPAM
jgi:hypothetical protein